MKPRLLPHLDGREVTRFDGRKQVLHTRGAEVVDYRLSARERIIDDRRRSQHRVHYAGAGRARDLRRIQRAWIDFPGVAGGILALLGLSGLAVLPINWIGAALLILGVSMFVLEAKFTSHGVLGGGGTIAMILGALLLINGPPEMRIHLSTALAVTIPFALITMFLVSLVIRARANKVGDGGRRLARRDRRGSHGAFADGKVFVHGEYWDAVSSSPC